MYRKRTPTSMLAVEGDSSSYFLPVKMSMATKWHLAEPCLPVLEVDTSATCMGNLFRMCSSAKDQEVIKCITLQGNPLRQTYPFLRIVPACTQER